MESMIITYLDQEINISKEYCMAFYLRDRYGRLAEAKAKSYMQLYYDKYCDFLTFASKFCADGCKMVFSLFDELIKDLMAFKTYDVDKERILQEYGDFIFENWLYMHKRINELCESVDNDIESQRQLRELRKASRSRVVGGGFGISGALKGMALAGVFNTASGIMHSGANAIGNAKTRLLVNRKYQEIYESKDMQTMVEECFKNCIIRCEKVLEEYLNLPSFPIEENICRAKTLTKNLSQIPANEQPKVIADIIKLNPYDFEIYKQILPISGDCTGILHKISSHFPGGLDQGWKSEYDNLRRSIFTKKIQEQVRQPIKSHFAQIEYDEDYWDKAEKLKDMVEQKILNLASFYGYDKNDIIVTVQINSCKYTVGELSQEAEINMRTVGDITYQTHELAQKARVNHEAANELLKFLNGADYTEILRIIQTAQELNNKEPQGSVSDIIKIVEDKEVAYRTFRGVVYDTISLKEKVESNFRICDNLLLESENADYKTFNEILSKVEKMNQEMPAGSVSQYLEKLAEKEIHYRTINNVIYDTYDLAQKVLHNQESAVELLENCKKSKNVNLCDILSQLYSLNHEEPVGSISEYLDQFLTEFFKRAESNKKVFRDITFTSVLNRQDVECGFNLFIGKFISGKPTFENVTALKKELKNLPSETPIYKTVASYVSEVEESLKKEQVHKQLVEEAERRDIQRALITIGLGTVLALCWVLVPLISAYGHPTNFKDMIKYMYNNRDSSAFPVYLGVATIYAITEIVAIKEIGKTFLSSKKGMHR